MSESGSKISRSSCSEIHSLICMFKREFAFLENIQEGICETQIKLDSEKELSCQSYVNEKATKFKYVANLELRVSML